MRDWRARQFEIDLDRVVDEPLQGSQGSQGANHDDPGEQAFPHALEPQSAENVKGRAAFLLVQSRHDGIRRVGYHGTEDASDVASHKGHGQLLTFGTLVYMWPSELWFSQYICPVVEFLAIPAV